MSDEETAKYLVKMWVKYFKADAEVDILAALRAARREERERAASTALGFSHALTPISPSACQRIASAIRALGDGEES